MKRKKLKRGIAALLSVILVAGSLAVMPDNKTVVQAAGGESTAKAISGLGTDIIADPKVPISSSDKWKGSYVYFGNYNDTPVKYRVLDSNTTVFGGTTMLLDCNSILWTGDNPSSAYDDSSKVWADSNIRTYLNWTFLRGNFTTAEQNAIAESFKSSVDGTDGNGCYHSEYISLVGDKIFFLDAKEATNTSYGYGPEDVASREKTGGNDLWWLRSSNINHDDYAVIVDMDGQFRDTRVNITGIGVSPALNVDLSSVLFSSVISGTAGETGAEYKLTLIDENLTIEKNGAIKREEDTVTIQCIIRGTNNSRPTQASVLLLDKEYTEGNTNDAEVLYYGALDRYGSFTLPEALSDKVCGRDYYAYIIAEDINGVAETDYASEPVKIFIPWSVKSKNLGTSGIVDPIVPASRSDAWTGSYVYFGTYDTDGDGTPEPVKYRMLDSNTTIFGGKTMLLDCNSILETRPFDDDSNVWADSDIRTYLNGTFLTGNFTTAEQNAIASSTKNAADSTDGDAWDYLNYIPISGDKIFLLDTWEANNTSYGYSNIGDNAVNRVKTGGNGFWWLRSRDDEYCCYVYTDGFFASRDSAVTYVGVSPALNVNLASVLFSSIVNDTGSYVGPEYKLTLIDENLTVAIDGTVIRSEDRIMVPYTIGGTNSANATQASVFLLDKEYTEGNTNDAEVLYYGALNSNDSFTLPEALSDKVCGIDYYAYIIAEDINGVAETDYASEPVKIFIPWSVKSKNLGTSGIVDPIVPASNSDAWTGSYVYFGTYDTDGDGTPEPVKYRILDSNTTVFGGKTMLLDCNSILETRPFDDDSNVWADSDIRTYLNGTFLTDNFTTAEQNAIASSTKNAADSTDGDGWIELNFATLSGDKIFLLDAKEATNTSYGYGNTNSGSESIKKGNSGYWWLRSASSYSADYVGIGHHAGSIIDGEVNDTIVSVSPALNVNLASVLFSSIVNGTGSYVGPEYKLTLIDENLTVAIDGTVIRSEDRIMVPYTIGGTNSANATQASVFLLDKEYTEGNTNDAEVLYYGALNSNGSFTLPEALSDKVCGRDYYAYIIAEDINGVAETDYASEPVELTEIYDGIDNVAVELDAPESSEALDTEVSILTSGITGATVTWKEGEATVTGNADYSIVYTAYITVSKNENLLWTPTVTATVNGQQASVVRQDGSTVILTYTFAVTDKERLISITNPQSITVANGTSYEEMNLPEKVYITTEGNTYTEADVEWDTANPASGSYDPDILTEQTVVLKGTVTCPEGIDSNNVSLTTTITITISADDTEPEETEPEETEPEETEPEETEPEDKEPEETEPEDKEPEDKESEETEPEDKEPEDKESEYEITDGNDSEWTVDSDEGITITGSGDDEDFVGIRINGEFIDSSNYTIEKNGAVTLKKEYLDTLPADTYTIDMVWNDGKASTEITIKNSSVTGSPDAGDGGNVHLWILFVIGLGLVGVVIISRRKSVID